MFEFLGTIIIVAGILVVLSKGVMIISQAHECIVERLGVYYATWGAGIHFKIPFIDRVVDRVSLKEQVIDFDPQSVITEDNVQLSVDTVVFFQVTDAKLLCYGVEDPLMAIGNLVATTVRNIIGGMELDKTLTSRDEINKELREVLDSATDSWGIKVNRVEIKNIDPPRSILEAMEKQMRAERDKRAQILEAEGIKESAILKASGEKEAAILKAEGEKQVQITEAEGEASAIMSVNKALADGLGLIKTAGAEDLLIKTQSIEAMKEVATSDGTKVIIPSNMQGLVGTLAGMKEALVD